MVFRWLAPETRCIFVNWRLARSDFLRRKWPCLPLVRITFPPPVILKRFAVDLCVFSLYFLFLFFFFPRFLLFFATFFLLFCECSKKINKIDTVFTETRLFGGEYLLPKTIRCGVLTNQTLCFVSGRDRFGRFIQIPRSLIK